MADTVTIDGKEWDFTGLPRHYYEGLPIMVDVEVQTPPPFGNPYTIDCLAGDVPRYRDNGMPVYETHHVQLERDGKPLTFADRRPTWRAGEAEGWRPTRRSTAFVDRQVGDELEGEAIEC